MKVLIADKFSEGGVDRLKRAGCDVIMEPTLSGDELMEVIRRVEPRVLVVRGTKVTAGMLETSDSLGVVVRAGAGVNSIDVSTASKRSILVANCPGRNAVAVAELTFALILALDRRIVENVTDLRDGVWNKKIYSTARGLKGRTLGVIGMGRIGQEVVRRAQGFEMPVVAWSRSLTDEEAERLGVTRCERLVDVADRCDILTIHLAATPQTRQIIDAKVLERIEPGGYVVNTARAEVMDYDALARMVSERNLRVGLDVFPGEPSGGDGTVGHPIFSMDGVVYGTHHIGASTDQAQEAIAGEAVDIIVHYMRTGHVKNSVNLRARTSARFVLVVRHRNCPGVLAHTLHAIRLAGVNIEEMENVICEGAESACAQIKLDAGLDDAVLQEIIDGNEHIIAASITALTESAPTA